MVLGQAPQDTAAVWDQVAQRMPKALAPEKPTVAGAVASAVLPGAVVGLVDRQRHPIVWWVFGVIPLAWAGARLVLAVGGTK